MDRTVALCQNCHTEHANPAPIKAEEQRQTRDFEELRRQREKEANLAERLRQQEQQQYALKDQHERDAEERRHREAQEARDRELARIEANSRRQERERGEQERQRRHEAQLREKQAMAEREARLVDRITPRQSQRHTALGFADRDALNKAEVQTMLQKGRLRRDDGMTPPGRTTAERERAMLSRLEHLPGSAVTKSDDGARFQKFQDRNERNKAEMQAYLQRAPGL